MSTSRREYETPRREAGSKAADIEKHDRATDSSFAAKRAGWHTSPGTATVGSGWGTAKVGWGRGSSSAVMLSNVRGFSPCGGARGRADYRHVDVQARI